MALGGVATLKLKSDAYTIFQEFKFMVEL